MKKKKHKPMFGHGFNDVDYFVYKTEILDGKMRILWSCPYYVKWYSLLRRCFSDKLHEREPSYKNCTICEDWKYLSNFIKWVDSQPNRNWVKCDLDKDLLVEGNKHYGPDTVVFITTKVNNFITNRTQIRRSSMIGVFYTENKQKPYRALCSNPLKSRESHIGYFATELEAHKAWQAKKYEYACMLADLQEDPRVADALRQRYTPDKDWTKS